MRSIPPGYLGLLFVCIWPALGVLILGLGHLTVSVPRFPQQWKPDVQPTFIVCPGISKEEVSSAFNELKARLGRKLPITHLREANNCACTSNTMPNFGTVELVPLVVSRSDVKVAAGMTKRFWNQDKEVLSACVSVPGQAGDLPAEDRLQVYAHEILHTLGYDHAYMYGWYYRVDAYGVRNPAGHNTRGWPDPFHVMSSSVCSTCTSFRHM